MKKFLTIAGSDCSGGAGVQADIRTATMHGLFSTSVITAQTVQTGSGVRNILPTPVDFLRDGLDAVHTCGMPDAVKIGMLCNEETVLAVADALAKYNAKNVVLDTVFASTGGVALLDEKGILAVKSKLIERCSVITPNIPEAEKLCGMKIGGRKDMERCALALAERFGVRVVITGGHMDGECADLLFADGFFWFCGKKVQGATHGTGCKFSSALACNLALGRSVQDSVRMAKGFVRERILTDSGGGR